MKAGKTNTAIDELAYKLELAKKLEASAKLDRIKAEENLISALSIKKDEGTVSKSTDYYNVSLKFSLSRTLDDEKVYQLSDEHFDLCFKNKPSLILKEYRSLSDDELLIISDCITEKPAKVSVSVSRKND